MTSKDALFILIGFFIGTLVTGLVADRRMQGLQANQVVSVGDDPADPILEINHDGCEYVVYQPTGGMDHKANCRNSECPLKG